MLGNFSYFLSSFDFCFKNINFFENKSGIPSEDNLDGTVWIQIRSDVL